IPSNNVWNKIAGELELEQEKYSIKLYHLEIIPPASTWEKISTILDEEATLPRIPSTRRIIPIVKYAAAACLVSIIAFGGYKILNRQTNIPVVAAKKVLPQKKSSTNQTPDQKTFVETKPVLSNNLPKEGKFTRSTVARKNISPTRLIQMMDPSFGISPAPADPFQQASLVGNIPGSHPVVSDNDYLTFLNPDGYLVRISKKLAQTLGCIYPDRNSQQYIHCQEQLKKWGDKIAQSPVSSSPDNFMDILDIIRSVNE
ncbi:MAG TPA: hypothetical protein VGG71_04045, partial [Chitinophagaceae bacterium]